MKETIHIKRPVFDKSAGRSVMRSFAVVVDLAKLDWAYQRAYNNANAFTSIAYDSVRVEMVPEVKNA